MQLLTFYAAASAFAGALVALTVYHLAVVRPALRRARALLDLHDHPDRRKRTGAPPASWARSKAAKMQQNASIARLQERIGELEALSAADLSRAGFVRYDAFAGAGPGLSYALALLNRQGDGVVLTSIYSREDSRTFGKPVAGFKPTVQASAEELEAIERARQAAS